jgi:glycosyltransferase involved in cell wall biosynthesis
MKVVHVAPFSQVGGIAYVSNLISDHAPYCSGADWVEVDSTVPDKNRENWGRRSLHMLRICFEIQKAVRAAERPVVLHAHTSSYAAFFEKMIFLLTGKAFGARTILHVHGGAFDEFYTRMPESVQVVIRLLLQVPDGLLTLSEEWARFFRRIAPDAEIRVLENGVVLPSLNGASHTQPQRSNSVRANDSFDILFLGRIEPEKGCQEIIEAAKKLEESIPGKIKFHLYGEAASPATMKSFKEEASDGADKSVRFHGLVTGEEKHRALQEADLFVLPSWAEGMPISVLEAMAYGLPVIATRVGALPELVDTEGGILIESKNSQQLVQAISTLYNRRDLARKMGRVNQAKVKDRYSAENYVQGLCSIYHDVTK